MPLFPSDLKISIAGDLGSGKSTICKLLKTNLDFTVYSMGEAWRQLAEKKQMTILELNKYSETHSLDEEMDQAMAALADAPQNIIFDSRLAWHFIPRSFKVYLTVDANIAAERIFNDKRGKSEGYSDLKETLESVQKRRSSEYNRYFKKYGVDCARLENYDLVIDTSHATPVSISELIIDKLAAWSRQIPFNHHWLSPRTPYPTRGVDSLNNGEPVNTDEFALTGKMPEGEPVSLLSIDYDYFILKGHQQVSTALMAETNLMPVRVVAQNDSKLSIGLSAYDYVKTNCSLPLVQEWEKFHRFRYAKYPALFINT